MPALRPLLDIDDERKSQRLYPGHMKNPAGAGSGGSVISAVPPPPLTFMLSAVKYISLNRNRAKRPHWRCLRAGPDGPLDAAAAWL